MGVRFPSVSSNTFVGPLPANANETVVLVTPPLTITLDFAQVFLVWAVAISAGTGTTSFTWKFRRGTTATGPLVQPASITTLATAGTTSGGAGCYFDTPGAVAGQQYALTIIQNGATVAGTFVDGAVLAFAL